MAGEVRDSFALATHIGQPIVGPATTAFVDGIHTAPLVAAAAITGAAVVVWLLMGTAGTRAEDGQGR